MAKWYGDHQIKKLTTKQMKGVDNAWIDTDGNMYRCGYMDHNAWASDYITYKLCKGDLEKAEAFQEKLAGWCSYPYVALHKLGWFRILQWGSHELPSLLCENDKPVLNQEQADTVLLWCCLNKIDYDKFVNSINK